MPTTLQEITSILDEKNINYDVHENGKLIITSLQTKEYTDKDGDHSMPLLISLNSPGTLVMIIVPFCYQIPEHSDNRIFEFFLSLNLRNHMLKFSYDPKDGEIQARMDIFLAESTLHTTQLLTAVHTMYKIIEDLHPQIATQLEKKFEVHSKKEQAQKIMEEVLRKREHPSSSEEEDSSSSDEDLWL